MLSFEETLKKITNQHKSIEPKSNNNNLLNNALDMNKIYQVSSNFKLTNQLKSQIQMSKGYDKYF